MISESEIIENRRLSVLPPKISINPRERVEPENISFTFNGGYYLGQVDSEATQLSLRPVPRHPIALTWCPGTLSITVDDSTITKKLCILNVCPRSIFIHCCGFWNEEARLGAYWQCYPRTRFLLAPGLHAEVFVRAEPKSESPIPCANAGLQVAAAHKRDHVIAYFVVPLTVRFRNYVTPPLPNPISSFMDM